MEGLERPPHACGSHFGSFAAVLGAQLAIVHDVGLDSSVARLPHRHIDFDFSPRLSVVWRRRDVDLQLVGPSLFGDTVRPPQVFLQTSQAGMVANKDVQAALRLSRALP